MVGNVIVQCELSLISIFQFLRPQENMKFIHGGHFEFQKNLKTRAHSIIARRRIMIKKVKTNVITQANALKKPAAFQVIAPTRSNYGRKINVKNHNKSTILIFLPAIIELVQELLISNMHNKLEEDTCENFEVIAPTRSNYWRKMRKIAINRPFWIFFQPLLNLSKNYLLVTCITNLKRICEKLFKLSRPQGQIIDVKWEKSQ